MPEGVAPHVGAWIGNIYYTESFVILVDVAPHVDVQIEMIRPRLIVRQTRYNKNYSGRLNKEGEQYEAGAD